MKRNLLWFTAGAIGIIVTAGLSGLIFLKTGANGFSARSEPSLLETLAAQQARSMSMPKGAKSRSNPIGKSKEVLDDAMAHWADHCAVCHGNDGSGQVDMGRQMYPHAPDMRKEPTQLLTDGELFYIIENGIRLRAGCPPGAARKSARRTLGNWSISFGTCPTYPKPKLPKWKS